MSDFDDDDQPIEGPRASSDRPAKGRGGRDDADRSGGRPPADDQDWDDEPVASRGAAGGRGGAGDDDWDDDDWDDDDDGGGRGGRRDLTLIIAIAAGVAIIALVVILTRPKSDNTATTEGTTTPAGATTATKPNFCDDWPAIIGGDGKNVSKGEGVYIWSDFTGYHLRSNRTDVVVVKATSPGSFKVKDKGNATASAAAGKEVTFTLPAGAGATGPDLDVNCESSAMTFDVTAAGKPVPASEVKLGGSGKADANPVTLTRGS